MSLFQAFLLGLVQGLTEFLPVSSSAHLVFVQHLMSFSEPLLLFDVVVHLGTLASLLLYFVEDLVHLIRDSIYGFFFLLRRKPVAEILETAPYSRWAFGILIASIPTGLMGILFKDWFEALFGSLHAVGLALLATSLILWATRFKKGEKGIEKVRVLDYLAIGVMQGVAIIPGISRSGSTIAAAFFVGLERETAFRFSFLLAIPAILGAGVLELREGLQVGPGMWPALGVGFLTAAGVGYLSIRLVSAVVRKGKLHRFALYTLSLGLLTLFLSTRIE